MLQNEIKKILKEYEKDKVEDLTTVNWECISISQNLSESFIREFKDKLKWFWISEFQILSESFIREFKNYINWNWISICQELSPNFIREFKDKLNLNALENRSLIKIDHYEEITIFFPKDVTRFELMDLD